MRRGLIVFLVGGGLLVGGLFKISRASEKGGDDPKPAPPPAAAPTFQQDILPIISKTCLRCHNPRKKDGKLDMSTREAMLKGGNSGPAFVPGDAEKSLMVEMIFFDEMPPKNQRPRLTEAEVRKLKAWINARAPAGEKPSETSERGAVGQSARAS